MLISSAQLRSFKLELLLNLVTTVDAALGRPAIAPNRMLADVLLINFSQRINNILVAFLLHLLH